MSMDNNTNNDTLVEVRVQHVFMNLLPSASILIISVFRVVQSFVVSEINNFVCLNSPTELICGHFGINNNLISHSQILL